jgi:hypothetical protein
MNSAYFVRNLQSQFEQVIFPGRRAPHQKRLVVHLGNCSVRANMASTNWLEEHGMVLMPDQPYLLDLAPETSICFLQ